MNSEKQDFFDKPENVQLLIKGLYISCGVLFLLDFIIHRHTIHPLEWIWGFYPVYGFIGCVVLVIVAKWMRLLIMRDESYYDGDSTSQQQSNDK